MYVCMYVYICQDGGAVGFVDVAKLLFALSSLAQPLKLVRSIPEHFIVIQSLRRTFLRRNSRNKYFELKKTRGAPMGRPKLELLASNGVHICHAI